MTETELLYILKIAECGNITKAAGELYISQPSLSLFLSKTEQEYGHILFERTQSGLVLTEFGQKYVSTAHLILKEYRRFQNELEEIRQLKKGELRFGLPQYLGTILLPLVLPIYTAEYPDITVRYYEDSSANLTKMLRDGRIDFAITHSFQKQDAPCSERLLTDPFYLVAPSHEKKAVRPPFPTADLSQFADRSFILSAPGQRSREIADLILNKSGITPKKCYITKNMETAKRMTAAGLGITFLPGSYLNLFSDTEGLNIYALPDDIRVSWDLILTCSKEIHLPFAAREFIRLTKSLLA